MSLVFGDIEITNNISGVGLSSRRPARVATTAAETLSSSFANGQVIDGITLVTGNRILIKNQSNPIQNGIYEVKSSGSPSRTPDCDDGDAVSGSSIFIQEGTVNGGTEWFCISISGADIVNTNQLLFKLASGDISGNGSSTDNAIVRWDGTTGTKIQNSSILVDDSNNMTGLQYVQFSDIAAPVNPLSGQGRLYKKTGDDGIFWKPDAAGPEVDLTLGGGSGEANTVSNIGTAGVGVYKQKVGVNFELKKINSTSSTSGLQIVDDTGNDELDVNMAINLLTQDNSPDQAADFIATYDTSGSVHKKVLLKTAVKTRDYWDAIADPTGAGDFTTVAAAFLAGNQTVFARDGTYLETSNIIIPDGGFLMGESMDKTIINFQSAAYTIKVDGSGGTIMTAGTITATFGSSAVVGVGTTFTSISLPCFILIDQNYYPVASITNATNLVIGPTYRGPTKTGIAYRLQQMISSVSIEKFTVINSTTAALYLRAVRHAEFEDIVFRNNATGVQVIACGNTHFQSIMCQNQSSHGYIITDTTSCILEGCQAFNSGGHGYQVNGKSKDIEINTCQGSHSASNGLMIEGTSEDITVNGSIFNNNKLCGIETVPGTITATVNGCAMNGNGTYGIDFDSIYNVVDACIIGNNTLSGIRAGDRGTISNNQVFQNGTYGIELEADDRCQVVGNHVYDNTTDGIYTDRNDNTIGNNVITGNVHGILVDGGSGSGGGHRNIISNNTIRDNSNDGICVTTNATYNKISGNSCNSNGSDGIELKTNCHYTTINNNTCTGNSVWGINIEGNRCVVNSNFTSGNTSGGIRIESGSTDVTYYSNNTQGDTTGFSDAGTITTGYEPVFANRLDSRSATTLALGYDKATKVEIADTGVITEVQGNLDVLQGVDVTGNETITGYIQFSDMAAPANPSAGQGRLYKKTGDDGIFWKPDVAGPEIDLTADVGEANTASSAGGTSIYKTKTGVDLVFKGLTATTAKIALSANTNDVGIDVTEANLTLNNIGGTLGVAKGGTNLTLYAVGDLLYASGATALSKLADVATGNALISGGVGIAPSWGKINLTTHVDGALPTANAGVPSGGTTAQVLSKINGTNYNTQWVTLPVFGTERTYAKDEAESTTTSTTLQTKTTLTTGSLLGGTYFLNYTFEVSNASNGVLTEVEVVLDGTVVALPTMEADNDYLLFGGFVQQVLTAGVKTATIKYRVQTTGTAKIRRARLELYRVA